MLSTVHQSSESAKSLDLFDNQPRRKIPPYPVNLYELVPLLLNDHPDWREEDIIEFVEEKTHHLIHSEDVITVRALYRRHLALEAEFQV